VIYCGGTDQAKVPLDLLTQISPLGSRNGLLFTKSSDAMRVKIYQLIEQIVEVGAEAGYNRAHKHTDTPNAETIKQCIQEYIMDGFHEHFEFDLEE